MPNKTKKKKEKNDSVFRSFRRTYKNEYIDDFRAPGLLHHAIKTFKTIFKNWKLFGGLLLVVVAFNTIFVGLYSQNTVDNIKTTIDTVTEESYANRPSEFIKAGFVLISTITTGGISQSLSGGQEIIVSFMFILIWLTTIYYLRQILAGKKVTMRKGLYNSLSPLIPAFLVFQTILLEMLPIFLLIIFYNAALQTDFLSTPFYALIFIVFAILVITLSCYLISTSIIALAAVSAPGVYPMEALRATKDLMFHRRIQFVIRIFFLVFVVGLNYAIIMLPVILLDSLFKSSFEWTANIPCISFFLLTMTCFNFMYISAYIYLYYREMLDYEPKRS